MFTNPNRCPWPGGAKCAASVVFDCDADTLLHIAMPDDAYKKLASLSYLQYDEVAVPRIVELFDHLGIKQTFFVPAWCIEKNPKPFEPIVASGHEIGNHSYLHEDLERHSREAELYWLRRASDVIESFSGVRPVGFRSPWAKYSENTLDLLASEGFLYESTLMHDENPYILRTRSGDLIELPTDWTVLDDWSHYMHFVDLEYLSPPKAPDETAAVWWAEFEAIHEYGGVFVTAFHPMIGGRLARLRRLGQLIERMLAMGDVWFAPLKDIAAHVRSSIDAGEFTPRVVDVPLYQPGRIEALRAGFVSDELAITVE